MAIKSARWTRFDLERFPEDGNRYEVLDGELLVTPQPAPRHQHVVMQLFSALIPYLKEHGVSGPQVRGRTCPVPSSSWRFCRHLRVHAGAIWT